MSLQEHLLTFPRCEPCTRHVSIQQGSFEALLNRYMPGAYGYTPRISVASATRATASRYDPMRRFVSCSSAFAREAR